MEQPIWNTATGSLGSYPSGIALAVQLSATAQLPASNITYSLLSGSLPTGLSIDSEGLITGTPSLVTSSTASSFGVRATDNFNNIRDRTFSMSVSGVVTPTFTTAPGSLLSTIDSVWNEIQINYSNPDPSNLVEVRLKEGLLPPGLELSPTGLIRGYPQPPVSFITAATVVTTSTITQDTVNLVTCLSTVGFSVGRPVVFTGTTIGGITAGFTYYVKTINSSTTFTVAVTQNGDIYPLNSDFGSMTVTLPAISVGSPEVRQYPFVLQLVSKFGGTLASYSITVINQNTPVPRGPGAVPNSRVPVILNSRPLTYNVSSSDPYYGYYVLPSVPPSQPINIGTIQSDNYFAFKIVGHDFDGMNLVYSYSGLPLGLVGDSNTGWITGVPTLGSSGINNYGFSVSVSKLLYPSITSPYFLFSFNLSKDITGRITWITPADLGTINNGTPSSLSVIAQSDVALSYRISSGALPPNLTLLSNGEISGIVADQPTEDFLLKNQTTDFSFTIQAYSSVYSAVISSKTFKVTVLQKYDQPTDILYFKATPSLQDRSIINSLLNNTDLIPTEYLYRADDPNFGKASDVVYAHLYGVYASDINEYLVAVTRNHYWRNIILGELKTAVAKNSAGDVIYEVVYSEVIDNIAIPNNTNMVNTPSGSIYWNRPINLFLGPWYTSITDIYTSYAGILGQQYYTSLTPGYARTLYPNSLLNMRNRVSSVLGQEYDSSLLPLWLTSQQPNGSTLGYTQAWVICYTKPGYSATVKNNIQTSAGTPASTQWPYTLNQVNFNIDRFTVDKSITYNYDKNFTPPAWTSLPSATPSPDPTDSKDFYVLFPRTTILPDKTQY